MARNGSEKKTRVLFACEKQGTGGPLLSALLRAPELEIFEFVGTPDGIFHKAVAKSADLAVLFFPENTDEHERCVRRIWRGTYSHILLLTDGDVSDEISSKTDRVDIRSAASSKNNVDSLVAHVISLGSIKHRPDNTKAAERPAQEKPRDAANVLADGALATKIVAVGASTGGTEALASMFRGLHPTMPGIVVVQHMPPVFTEMFAQRLDKELPFDVFEAKDNVQIKLNTIHIAPGDRHLLVKKVGSNYFTVLGDKTKVGGHCPAVNVLFSSVAKVAGAAATGVILTGMGGDGAEGMLEMRSRGAYTIGQDEKSCVVYGMPRKAFEIGAVARQAPLADIAGILMSHLGTAP